MKPSMVPDTAIRFTIREKENVPEYTSMLLLFIHFFKSCETQISVAQAQDIFLNDSSDDSP